MSVQEITMFIHMRIYDIFMISQIIQRVKSQLIYIYIYTV